MNFKDIIFKFKHLELLINSKSDKSHSHNNEYYTKEEIDAMFRNMLSYEKVDNNNMFIINNKKAISNNK